MIDLMTLNGIPPTCLLTLEEAQRSAIIEKDKKAVNTRTILPELDIIGDTLITEFERWGSTYIHRPLKPRRITCWSKTLSQGETMFTPHPHSDGDYAAREFLDEDIITLRLLCVSSDPAQFVDLTQRADMFTILNKYRTAQYSQFLKDDFMDAAIGMNTRIVTPAPWEFIIFDGITPHKATPATSDNDRILLSQTVQFELPNGWRERIKAGDAPRWNPQMNLIPNK